MADYGIFREKDARRIAKATKRVEGMPGTFLHVPYRPARTFQPQQRTNSTFASAHTVREYDPSTGEVIQVFDRGRRRSDSPSASQDWGILYSSDGYLYCSGQGYINGSTHGVIRKYDPDTGECLWTSSAGAFSGPIHGSPGSSNTTLNNYIVEATDGYIWCLGTDSSGFCVGRFNPSTGAQTHKVGYTGPEGIYALDSGRVAVVGGLGGGKFLVILDATATELGNYATSSISAVCVYSSGSRIAIGDNAGGSPNLKILSSANGSVLDSRTSPGIAYQAIACDGTTLYATGTSYYSYDANNLATVNWTHARDGTFVTGQKRLVLQGGYLYEWAPHIRKLNISDGSEVWESSGASRNPQTAPSGYAGCAIGSDFLVTLSPDADQQFYCLSLSDGSCRWFDQQDDVPRSVHVSSNDRAFVCGTRVLT